MPDLILAVTATTSTVSVYTATIKPKGATAVPGLGKVGFADGSPVGRGCGVITRVTVVKAFDKDAGHGVEIAVGGVAEWDVLAIDGEDAESGGALAIERVMIREAEADELAAAQGTNSAVDIPARSTNR